MNDAILWPVAALAALTAIVAWHMYRRRITEIRSREIHPQSLATRRAAGAALEDTAAADNFQNLFEVPVLFYVVCLAITVTGLGSLPQVGLAWVYVGLRAAHSYVHLSGNRVIRRFSLFMASNVGLLALWLLFLYALATH